MMELFWWMMVGHFAVDYPLQGSQTAIQKSPLTDNELSKAVPWYYWLTAHALMHGGVVAWATGFIWLGLAETMCHWFIDYGKCLKRYGIHTDQVLHVLSKVIWVLLCVSICR
jgi:hypothetical protein